MLSGKIAIVTGAARGIGRSIAEKFAQQGAKVYANDLELDAIEFSPGIAKLPFDVADSQALKQALIAVFKQEGRIDCVVNNAALIANQKLGMVTKDLLQKMYAVNVFAVLDMIQVVSRLMARNGGGSIVNIASATAVHGSAGQVAYSSSKGAIISMTKSSAKELAPLGVRVNAVAPGIVQTERFSELYETDGAKISDRISRIPIGRLAMPDDIANACTFLASDAASYISGQVLGVDGACVM
jgi:3-oxoacyl-[acyl-carrier protein] reductase